MFINNSNIKETTGIVILFVLYMFPYIIKVFVTPSIVGYMYNKVNKLPLVITVPYPLCYKLKQL